jgi:hypothetical protein
MTCDKCGNTLLAADWSEYVNDGLVLNFWSCWKCGNRFETEAYMSADAQSEIESGWCESFFRHCWWRKSSENTTWQTDQH